MSFKYWDDCVDAEDMEEMWMDTRVSDEWISVGETKGRKVHLSRDPDGQVYLTQTEMTAVAGIIVRRHFSSHIDTDMICAISEIGSSRQPLAESYDRKTKNVSIGLMGILPATAEWIFKDLGFRAYDIEGKPDMLYRPFVNVYIGASYLNWLSGYNGKERNEEFVVRAFIGGPKKASHKSTSGYWKRYLSVKENLQIKSIGDEWAYWDSKTSKEDVEELWRCPEVLKEWEKSGERRGSVRFSLDSNKRPYLSRVEVKAVADITISRHFASRGLRSEFLSALAELSSMRFLHGVDSKSGIMGIGYPTALWLYNDVGYKARIIRSGEDLSMPFVSMYYGAAYVLWLSQYEGRERTHEFIVQAYLRGPENVNVQETGPLWLKFQELLPYYTDKHHGSCTIS
ncbi:hypothetical protein EJ110_NYTH09328 [Nymphaea thermarum]|nr:hypothetical protein EJ110_NYTH09328 [Nymphaea thermarum]